jgi:thymidylate synthase
MEFHFDNVNDAFVDLVYLIDTMDQRKGMIVKRPSRNGNVLQFVEPVTIHYRNPRQRVLFNSARDANPFFHLFESLWMLAGYKTVKPLAYYAANIMNYSDNGETLNGAYGDRWAYGMGPWGYRNVNQLEKIIERLQEFPDDRRCVLSMWNVQDDLLLMSTSKDVCCNTHAYFAMSENGDLDMTVCNRSNDMIWGMLGANYVHFTMLQEYMADRLSCGMGTYTHFTNNLHVYENNWKPEEWLEETPYILVRDAIKPLEADSSFPSQCARLMNGIDLEVDNQFLKTVAQPMFVAFRAHKQRRYRGDLSALRIMEKVQCPAWKAVGVEWITKRMHQWENRDETNA